MAAAITYLTGDATQPEGDGTRLIAHVCNDAGGWGRGFVLALSKRWPDPETIYRVWHQSRGLRLGFIQVIDVEPGLYVANMIAQHGYSRPGQPAIRYDALGSALKRVGDHALDLSASVHMPRIGCGLAGGTWEQVEPLITEHLVERGVPVTVYDLTENGPQ